MDIVWSLLIAIICVALCNLLLIPLGHLRQAKKKERQDLLETGLKSEAEILGYETSIRRNKQIVKYSFLSENGKKIICKKTIASNEQRYPIGSKTTVCYMSQYPSISILQPYAKTQEPSS